jgi:hypothetical protein
MECIRMSKCHLPNRDITYSLGYKPRIAIDDVKLHYTDPASIRVSFEFGAAEAWGRSRINLVGYRFPLVSAKRSNLALFLGHTVLHLHA